MRRGSPLGCSLLPARRFLQEVFWPERAPNVLGKRVAHFHGLAAIEMSRKNVKDGTRSFLHVHRSDVFELIADPLEKFFQGPCFVRLLFGFPLIVIETAHKERQL